MKQFFVILCLVFTSCASVQAKTALSVYADIRDLCGDIDEELAEQVDELGESTMTEVLRDGFSGETSYVEWDKRMAPYYEVVEISAYIRGALLWIESEYQSLVVRNANPYEFLVIIRPLILHYQSLVSVLDETPNMTSPPELQLVLLKLLPFTPKDELPEIEH